MGYPYSIKQVEQNKFHRVFQKEVDIETYISSWNEIFKMLNTNDDTLYLVSDYTNCQILIEEAEFQLLVNYLKSEPNFCNKLISAVIVNSDENLVRLSIWKEVYVLHGIYINGKICNDEKSAFEFIGINFFQ